MHYFLNLHLPTTLLSSRRFENRQHKFGRDVQKYASHLRDVNINRPIRNQTEKENLPLLLVAFRPVYYSPDRLKVLHITTKFVLPVLKPLRRNQRGAEMKVQEIMHIT